MFVEQIRSLHLHLHLQAICISAVCCSVWRTENLFNNPDHHNASKQDNEKDIVNSS